MPEKLKLPDRNRYGLIIPPQVSPNETEKLRASHLRRSFIDRHHLYFPKFAFKEAGSLATEFREHRFNAIWLPRRQHDRLHRRYSRAIYTYPEILIPAEEVMATFLDEAHMLDELNVCVRAVEMIDAAMYEGKVKRLKQASEHRTQRMERIQYLLTQTCGFEIISERIIDKATEGLETLAAA